MTSGSWVSCGQRVVWDMGRTLREPPYGLAEPFPIRVPAGSKHQKALGRSGLITRGRTGQLRDSPLKETATPATEGGGSAFAFTPKAEASWPGQLVHVRTQPDPAVDVEQKENSR